MKRFIVIAGILSGTLPLILCAQEESVFYKHELRVSIGTVDITEFKLEDKVSYTSISIAYFYRPEMYFWIGLNFVNYLGEKTYYDWRQYDVDGTFKDFSESKMKYCAIIAPEIRLSYLNKKAIILYSAFAGGIGFENGYDTKQQKYPNKFPCFHLCLFGLSANFGKNNNIFLGGEAGLGFKGLGSIHCGYRF